MIQRRQTERNVKRDNVCEKAEEGEILRLVLCANSSFLSLLLTPPPAPHIRFDPVNFTLNQKYWSSLAARVTWPDSDQENGHFSQNPRQFHKNLLAITASLSSTLQNSHLLPPGCAGNSVPVFLIISCLRPKGRWEGRDRSELTERWQRIRWLMEGRKEGNHTRWDSNRLETESRRRLN